MPRATPLSLSLPPFPPSPSWSRSREGFYEKPLPNSRSPTTTAGLAAIYTVAISQPARVVKVIITHDKRRDSGCTCLETRWDETTRIAERGDHQCHFSCQTKFSKSKGKHFLTFRTSFSAFTVRCTVLLKVRNKSQPKRKGEARRSEKGSSDESVWGGRRGREGGRERKSRRRSIGAQEPTIRRATPWEIALNLLNSKPSQKKRRVFSLSRSIEAVCIYI